MKIQIVKKSDNKSGRDRICPWLLDVPPPAPQEN